MRVYFHLNCAMAPNCLGKRILRHTRVTAKDRGERNFREKKAKKKRI